MKLNRIPYHLLKLLKAETAHDIGKWAMKKRLLSGGPHVVGSGYKFNGVTLNNNLGLAAGFDKNAELIDHIDHYGFGYVEVGSITYRGGHGNPKPRLFRVVGDHLLNRLGLNGLPAYRVKENIRASSKLNYGISIAKTHDPDIMGDKAIDDITETYKLLHTDGLYNVINISCPNTREGRTFEAIEPLTELLASLHSIRTDSSVPLLIKLSNSLALAPLETLEDILRVCADKVFGYVISNTLPYNHPEYGKGGFSGPWILPNSHRIIKIVKQLDSSKFIIGCGGINSAVGAKQLIEAGAQMLQVYTGFVTGRSAGPSFAYDLLQGMENT